MYTPRTPNRSEPANAEAGTVALTAPLATTAPLDRLTSEYPPPSQKPELAASAGVAIMEVSAGVTMAAASRTTAQPRRRARTGAFIGLVPSFVDEPNPARYLGPTILPPRYRQPSPNGASTSPAPGHSPK